MKIAITGAGGLLGRELLNIFKDKEYELYVFSSQYRNLKNEYDKINFHFFKSIDELRDHKIDIMLNCAYPRNEDGIEIANGLDYIAKVFNLCEETGVSYVINISSQSVYSQQRKTKATEYTELCLESKYAVGKYATEIMLNSICKNCKCINVRLASLISPDFDQRIVNKMVKKALNENKITVMGGAQIYGYLDARDAADALVTMCGTIIRSNKYKSLYNLGSDINYSLKEIAETIKRVIENCTDRTVELEYKNAENNYNSSLDGALFMNDFEWKPKINLEMTIKDIIAKDLQGESQL